MQLDVARKRVCDVLDAPRSTIYAREAAAVHDGHGVVIAFLKRGPRTKLSDDDLTELIRQVINDSPFSGEGHRKVTARLRREHGVHVGRKRVLRLMRLAGLLAPQRAKRRRRPRSHDGTIIPSAPDLLWGTDATMAWTKKDGWVWAFCCVDHFTAEAWTTVAKRGDRFACLEPLYDAVTERFGNVDRNLARGIALRHDWGPQYTSGHFQGDRVARDRGQPRLRRRASLQRLRRTLHKDPQGAVPVGSALRRRRGPAPGGDRVHPSLQR